ncbi:MAG: Holliday junction ATP-dependent DNA helicase RuvA [candidate division WS2 bacterium ADurb.Bin280]|uniref:Holliday junction branch migration complex subunit RuvA n=1 Tax=candidate division WS2 bacterium ADurb.Bin280 TaxID=1852829 RepID=A0A1V5SE13_9BACT|nr:MAG: Holliday junction ATP-dependent DNA helicase RuvA [candidate division WS2 bacterium ADurb.Bin280]
MINYIRGKIILKRSDAVVIDVSGLGYKVFVSKSALDACAVGRESEFFCFQHIREETNDLFGFVCEGDLDIFERLMQVGGVGPKVAMNIVSSLGREKITGAISQNNPAIFKSVSGVGGKLAAKIVIELKSRIGNEVLMPQEDETVDALLALGYKKQEIMSCIGEIPPEMTEINQKIKFALKLLSKK